MEEVVNPRALGNKLAARSRVRQIDIAGFDDATSSLIPIEVYEILREPRIVRVVILLLNVAVVAYLWRRQEVFE